MDTDKIVELSKAVEQYRKEYDNESLDVDIEVWNSSVNFRIKVWSKVDFHMIYSSHLVCDSHADACLIQRVLCAYINRFVI